MKRIPAKHPSVARWAFIVCSLFTALIPLSLAGCRGEPTAEAAPSAGPVSPECGRKGHPDCPLQAWMKSTLQAYLKAEEGERLATALEQLASHEPKGFDGWAKSARSAAKQARAGDFAAVKAECKSCHDEHRMAFRAKLKTERLF